jgi:predicted phosphodiesterase
MLVVSDIHNNPAAFSLINQIAEDFKVDVIVDAGDMTDYGTNLETGLVTKLVNVGIPYIFVTGNHDSPAVTEALTATPSVTILSGTSHTERGITFFGYPHPSGARMDVDPGSDKDMKNVAADVERAVEELDEPPDVLLVHDWRMAEAVTGKVPLIITGHTHKARIGESLGTVVINPGSTGDSGLRQLKRNGSYDTRYTLGIVYFDTEARRVAAFDAIEVSGLTGEFSLTRTLTGQSD